MDCTDPTKAGTQHLKYDVSGNFTYGFTEISNALGTIVLRYDLITSGVFQVKFVGFFSCIHFDSRCQFYALIINCNI